MRKYVVELLPEELADKLAVGNHRRGAVCAELACLMPLAQHANDGRPPARLCEVECVPYGLFSVEHSLAARLFGRGIHHLRANVLNGLWSGVILGKDKMVGIGSGGWRHFEPALGTLATGCSKHGNDVAIWIALAN